MFIPRTNSTLKDFVRVYNVIPEKLRQGIIAADQKFDWNRHQWDDVYDTAHAGDDKDFDRVTLLDPLILHHLHNYIDEVLDSYRKELNLSFEYSGRSAVSLNRYGPGTRMREHVDHIRSIFPGTTKGIPILTVLGLLNDDYHGGEFLLCNEVVELKAGDVIVFPSVFLYPHKVEEVTEGLRYSFVSWAY